MVARLEDPGAAAIVMSAVFEEAIVSYGLAPDRYLEQNPWGSARSTGH